MGSATADEMNSLTQDFYQRCASSFSDTRQAPWHGWEVLADAIEAEVSDMMERHGAVRVLDLGCGNLRFEKFLAQRFPDAKFEVVAVDACAELVEPALDEFERAAEDAVRANISIDFQQADILSSGYLNPRPKVLESFDLVVAFGIMHHVPTLQQREQLLQCMAEKLAPGGVAAISFWQFAESEKLLQKAKDATQRAAHELGFAPDGEGDFLMGWQDDEQAFRFCHSFTDEEIDALLQPLPQNIKQVERYCADGKTDSLNCYVVLEHVSR